MTTCNVCAEPLRKPVTCSLCEYVACTACTKRYILSLSDIPSCMSCRKPWSRDMLHSMLPKCFINGELKQHREQVLFDIERSMMPATQPLAEQKLALIRVDRETNRLLECRRVFSEKLMQMYNRPHPKTFDDQIQNEEDITTTRKIIKCLELDIVHQRTLTRLHEGHVASEKRVFIRGCPKDGCQGSLSQRWKCGLCNTNVCAHCLVIKEDNTEHTCSPDDVATAAMIKQETRPCPDCQVPIFRVDGCDLMWCVRCHTQFSWRSGLKTNLVNHNPHYYEYMRKTRGQERELGDQPCGGPPDLSSFLMLPDDDQTALFAIHRSFHHITHILYYRYRVNNDDNELARIEFMLDLISEEKFKKKIQRCEKERLKRREILGILRGYSENILFMMQRAIVENKSILPEFIALKDYTNTCFLRVQECWNCTSPLIAPSFDIL